MVNVGDYMKLQLRLEKLERERNELERRFRQVTRQSERSPCMRQNNAREQNTLIARIEEIEQQLELLRRELSGHGRQ